MAGRDILDAPMNKLYAPNKQAPGDLAPDVQAADVVIGFEPVPSDE